MSEGFLRRGGYWVVGQGVLLLAVMVCGLVWHHAQWPDWVWFAGATLLLAAVLCGLAGSLVLGRNLTPFPRPAQRTHLVRHGIYRVMRHPLYTAVVAAALGWALIRGSLPGLMTALALGLFLDRKARCEERWLRERFPDYAQYEQRVRRFIPWVY